MANNRGEYQKKIERKKKFYSIVSVTFILIGVVLFSYLAVQSAENVQDIDHSQLNIYTGECQYRVHKHRKGATYIFALSNGHEVRVSRNDVLNAEQLDEHKHLLVRYSTMYSNPLYRSYGAVSITSMDGTVEFVNMEESRRQSVVSAWISSILALICLLFEVLLIVISYGEKWKRWYRKQQKQMRKEKNHYQSDT